MEVEQSSGFHQDGGDGGNLGELKYSNLVIPVAFWADIPCVPAEFRLSSHLAGSINKHYYSPIDGH